LQIPSQRLVAFGPCNEVELNALYFEVFENCSVWKNRSHSIERTFQRIFANKGSQKAEKQNLIDVNSAKTHSSDSNEYDHEPPNPKFRNSNVKSGQFCGLCSPLSVEFLVCYRFFQFLFLMS